MAWYPSNRGDEALLTADITKFFPRMQAYLGIAAVPSGFMRSSLPGGPPDKHGMSDPMMRSVAVQGATKYSEYPAVSIVAGTSGNQKFFAAGGKMCAALHERCRNLRRARHLRRARQ